MLATLIDAPFSDKDWVFETKWDGFRMVAVVTKGTATLYSRNGTDVTARYAAVAKALGKLTHDVVLDGELVALDRRGVSRFQLLQNALRTKATLRYYLFDLMFLDGKDLRTLPLIKRKERLKAIIPKDRLIAFSEHRAEHGIKYFAEAKRAKEEGIIAKRAAGPYRSGVRTREWLKIKTGNRQEVVIIGFTAPQRSRAYFGSLALAVREGGAWKYIGHVGTGFSAQTLQELYQKMRPLRTKRSPCKTPAKIKQGTTWLTPKLVGEVKFTEWTAAGELRHPAFIGLRNDKKPTDVVRETPR